MTQVNLWGTQYAVQPNNQNRKPNAAGNPINQPVSIFTPCASYEHSSSRINEDGTTETIHDVGDYDKSGQQLPRRRTTVITTPDGRRVSAEQVDSHFTDEQRANTDPNNFSLSPEDEHIEEHYDGQGRLIRSERTDYNDAKAGPRTPINHEVTEIKYDSDDEKGVPSEIENPPRLDMNC